MSIRADLKANLLAALATIPGVREVTGEPIRLEALEDSRLPFVMLLSSDERRARVESQKMTECTWELDAWVYLPEGEDLEAWVDLVRAKIMADRSRGARALDTFISTISTDDVGIASPNRFFVAIVEITYRVKE